MAHVRHAPLVLVLVALATGSSACEPKRSSQEVPDPKSVPATLELPSEGNFGMLTIPKQATGDAAPGGDEPLTVELLDVQVEVTGRAARTKVTQVFKNHTSGRTEGEYTFRLPRDASITRLAMTVGKELVEGELVERERARNIYEDIVRKQKDPALLEWLGDGRFSTKIFPIEPNSTKTVVLEYEQMLPQDRGVVTYAYGLPVFDADAEGARATRMQTFTFSLTSADGRRLFAPRYAPQIKQSEEGPGGEVTLSARSFQPAGPMLVRFALGHEDEARVVYGRKEGDAFAMLDITPMWLDGSARAAVPGRVVLALDTSAGLGKPVVERGARTLEELAKLLPKTTELLAVTGDYTARPCSSAPISSDALAACLKDVDAGGATNLSELLEASLKFAQQGDEPAAVVLLTDGSASTGELDGELLTTTAARLARTSVHPVALHTVALGHAPDEEFLLKLARASRGQTVRVTPNMPPALAAQWIERTMNLPLVEDVTVRAIQGKFEDMTVREPVNIARGEALAVVGKLASKKVILEVKGTWMGEPWERRYSLKRPAYDEGSDAGFSALSRYWARGHIDRLVAASVPRGEVVETSIEYGVMSPYTSFLVLENEKMFKEHGVERRRDEARKEAQAARATKNLQKGDGLLQDLLQPREKLEESAERGKGAIEALSKLGAGQDRSPRGLGGLGLSGIGRGGGGISEPGFGSGALSDIGRGGGANELNMIDTPFGSASDSIGEDAIRALGNLDGPSEPNAVRGLGLLGAGRGGGVKSNRSGFLGKGASYGRGSRKPSISKTSLPRVVPGRPIVKGSLDREIVRRVLRRHRNELRYCYERELKRSPELAGAVNLKFSIGGKGRVVAAIIDKSTVGDRRVEACIVQKARRWVFPEPSGGMVTVIYPLRFIPGSSPASLPTPEDTATQWSYVRNITPASCDSEGIKRKLELVERKLEACVRTELERRSKLQHIDTFTFTIDARGKTKDPRGASTRPDMAGFSVCVASALERTTYPRSTPSSEGTGCTVELNVTASGRTYSKIPEKKRFAYMLEHPMQRDVLLDELSDIGGIEDVAGFKEVLESWLSSEHFDSLDALLVIRSAELEKDEVMEPLFVDVLFAQGASRSWTMGEVAQALELAPKYARASELEANFGRLCSVEQELSECVSLVSMLQALSVEEPLLARWRERLAERRGEELGRLERQRVEDMGNAELIERIAEMYRGLGEQERAARVLSELVEFSPHDYARRVRYARALSAQKAPLAACAQYATAVQLDPAERDTFRTMMALRRAYPEQAEGIKECIVDGVSKLPVQRAVSVVLTWEDPVADVDLHIHEVGGEEVWYQDTDSALGGLLYYDITDGFGPEIYVLGSGPAGTYDLSLVYFRGYDKPVKGTITILRNAGSPEESREVIRFELIRPDEDRELPVGSFEFTDADDPGIK